MCHNVFYAPLCEKISGYTTLYKYKLLLDYFWVHQTTYDWLVAVTGTTRGATEETEREEGDAECREEIQEG